MTHPNNMARWDEPISCRRDHEHHTREVTIDLTQPHGYADLGRIPRRLADQIGRFPLVIWDPDRHPVDGGPYCPAHDAVSETIVSHRIWEPRETALVLDVLEQPDEHPGAFCDFGAQLGWYSTLAGQLGRTVYAWEADPANRALLDLNLDATAEHAWRLGKRVTAESILPGDLRHVRLAKLDLEGAERDAIRLLWPLIEHDLVDHLLVECSPVFEPYYPDMLDDLIAAGFAAYRLPPKRQPPVSLDDPAEYLTPIGPDDLDLHQEDVWLRHKEAPW